VVATQTNLITRLNILDMDTLQVVMAKVMAKVIRNQLRVIRLPLIHQIIHRRLQITVRILAVLVMALAEASPLLVAPVAHENITHTAAAVVAKVGSKYQDISTIFTNCACSEQIDFFARRLMV
jgi:hypothetical protein